MLRFRGNGRTFVCIYMLGVCLNERSMEQFMCVCKLIFMCYVSPSVKCIKDTKYGCSMENVTLNIANNINKSYG